MVETVLMPFLQMDSRIGVNLDEADALRTKSEGSQQKLTKAQIQVSTAGG